jgi:hypothetical protein
VALAVVTASLLLVSLSSPTILLPALAATPRNQADCFEQTNFCITEPLFAQYYAGRGRENVLGFPVSRSFKLEGFTVQFFQRVVLQRQGEMVARLNLLDPGVLPVTHANQSIFPQPDPAIAAQAPPVDDPLYPQHVLDFVRSVAPDTWNGLPVRFFQTFNETVPLTPETEANPDLRTLLDLEIWGLPTSQPTYDPGNLGFVYQRFQRGIMHYRTDCGCTNGILVGDYLKAVITGRDLPPDLADEMRGSRYFGQYARGAPGWIARPADLPDSDLTAAFEPGQGTPTVVAEPTPISTPVPVQPTAVPEQPTTTPLAVGSLSGTLAQPFLAGTRVIVFDLPPLETQVGPDGAFTLDNLPPGKHFVYADDNYGSVSEQAEVNLTAGGTTTVSLSLQKKEAGDASIYMGRVLLPNGTGADHATVWRVGAAGRTFTGSSGNFTLLDTFDSANLNANDVSTIGKSPNQVTLVAASNDRSQWGFGRFDFSGGKDNQKIELTLSLRTPPPAAPVQVLDVKAHLGDATSRTFGGQKQFLTAWSLTQNDDVTVTLDPQDGKGPITTATMKNSGGVNCRGSRCPNPFEGSEQVVLLPADRHYKLQIKSASGQIPWDEAQIVTYPPLPNH